MRRKRREGSKERRDEEIGHKKMREKGMADPKGLRRDKAKG